MKSNEIVAKALLLISQDIDIASLRFGQMFVNFTGMEKLFYLNDDEILRKIINQYEWLKSVHISDVDKLTKIFHQRKFKEFRNELRKWNSHINKHEILTLWRLYKLKRRMFEIGQKCNNTNTK